ncbi:hypothetical protein [Aeromonas salmonicida]
MGFKVELAKIHSSRGNCKAPI